MQRAIFKWAGGKSRLADTIKSVMPEATRLVEPFAGSAALFFNSDFKHYLLADTNSDLINFYRQLKKEGKPFIEFCEAYFKPHHNDREFYLKLRDEFNATNDKRLKAAIFLFLNRHGYNGLCRYNSMGEYNVPFGSHDKTYFPKQPMEVFVKKARRVSFVCGDFAKTFAKAKAGDVVYCDPPYVPLSQTAKFTRYSDKDFLEAEQHRLAQHAQELANRGIPVIISNHHTPFTQELYRHADCHVFKVQRSISCNGLRRRKVEEVLAVFK